MKLMIVKTCDKDIYFNYHRIERRKEATLLGASQVLEGKIVIEDAQPKDLEQVKTLFDAGDLPKLAQKLVDLGVIFYDELQT